MKIIAKQRKRQEKSKGIDEKATKKTQEHVACAFLATSNGDVLTAVLAERSRPRRDLILGSLQAWQERWCVFVTGAGGTLFQGAVIRAPPMKIDEKPPAPTGPGAQHRCLLKRFLRKNDTFSVRAAPGRLLRPAPALRIDTF